MEFTDTEGCFQITIKESQKNQSIWKTSLTFQIKLYIKDIALL